MSDYVIQRPLFRGVAAALFLIGLILLAASYALPQYAPDGEAALAFLPGGGGLWGIVLVVAALLYALLYFILSRFPAMSAEEKEARERRLHDTAVMKGSLEIFPEKALFSFLKLLVADHSLRSGDSTRIQRYAAYHEEGNNVYLDGDLQGAVEKVVMNLRSLLEWMSSTFKVYPEDQTGESIKLCLLPHLNSNRAGKGLPEKVAEYDEGARTLKELSGNVGTTYTAYREVLGKKLLTEE